MQFLVSNTECEFGDVDGLMHIVQANSAAEAIRAFKLQVSVHDADFRSYLLDGGFAERFWIVTLKENQHYERTGERLASAALFRRRVTNYFSDRPDLAKVYLDYYFLDDDEEIEFHPDLYIQFAQYLLAIKNEYTNLRAIPMAKIPVIQAN